MVNKKHVICYFGVQLSLIFLVKVNCLPVCPCENSSLCGTISLSNRHEVFVFSLQNNQSVWSKYCWGKITSIVSVGYMSTDLMCLAHRHKSRVIAIANYPLSTLPNRAHRTKWVQDHLSYVKSYLYDGINIDFESPVLENQTTIRKAYTLLVQEVFHVFKKDNPNFQVTVDVAWSPRCIDLRCYDIPGLAMHTDFLFVMAYDEQSQIYGDRCVALANSDFNKTLTGLGQYIDLGIRPDQLVLGVPWYGYDYPCVELTEEVCSIRHVPFRGANCSDAAGRQVDYRVVYPMMVNHSIGGRQWDSLSWSPFFNYQDNITGYQHQVRYDDPESLSLKYRVAEDLGLRGVGCWHMDSLDYSDAPYAVHQTSEMFRVLPGYCDCSLQ